MPGTFPNRQHIEARQLEQLRKLLDTIVPANRFYTEKLRAAGFDAHVNSLDDFRARRDSDRFSDRGKREIRVDASGLRNADARRPRDRSHAFHGDHHCVLAGRKRREVVVPVHVGVRHARTLHVRRIDRHGRTRQWIAFVRDRSGQRCCRLRLCDAGDQQQQQCREIGESLH